ncbi:MAG: hypothetical protein NTW87_27150 [Planctomycetota bacterium]|nr:hypothetical protein [Planctomycetota bacterium]
MGCRAMGSDPRDTTAASVDEALCRHCGKCCYKKVYVRHDVFITPFPCKFLDVRTSLCTVYPRRHEVNRACLSVPQGLKASAFPADCPYVATLAPPDYKPAREGWDWKGQWDDFDDLADDLGVSPEFREMVRARGPHAPPMYTEAGMPQL